MLDIDPQRMLDQLLRLVVAFVIAMPIAWDRERERRNLGLRTFPLVAVAACAFVTIARTAFGHAPEAMARVMEGVITGVGFLGGGAIVKRGLTVHGTTTAAAIWATAAIGVAVASNQADTAVMLALLGWCTLRFLKPLKRLAQRGAPPPDVGAEDTQGH